MKTKNKAVGSRIALGSISRATQGDIKGVIEGFGLYTPRADLA